MPERARDVVEYRKSGLSLNHVQGIARYRCSTLERFVRKHPEPPALPTAAWINKPTDPHTQPYDSKNR